MFHGLRVRRARRLAARTDQEWARALHARDPSALADLRLVIVEALWPVLRQRVPAQAEAFTQDVAQDALLHVLDRLGQFRGEARFTTWAVKVALRLAFSDLRRRRWQDVSLDGLLNAHPDGPPASGRVPSPESEVEADERTALVRAAVTEALTERQRTAIEAVMLHGMPLEEVARRMDTNRNALYKLLHDARLRLRAALLARGLGPDELLP